MSVRKFHFQLMSCHVLSCPVNVLSCPVNFGPEVAVCCPVNVLLCPVMSCHILSMSVLKSPCHFQLISCHVLLMSVVKSLCFVQLMSCHILSCPVNVLLMFCHVLSCPVNVPRPPPLPTRRVRTKPIRLANIRGRRRSVPSRRSAKTTTPDATITPSKATVNFGRG